MFNYIVVYTGFIFKVEPTIFASLTNKDETIEMFKLIEIYNVDHSKTFESHNEYYVGKYYQFVNKEIFTNEDDILKNIIHFYLTGIGHFDRNKLLKFDATLSKFGYPNGVFIHYDRYYHSIHEYSKRLSATIKLIFLDTYPI